jgi:hypothetical protein
MDIQLLKKRIKINEEQGCSSVEVKIDDLRQLVELAEQASPKGDKDTSVNGKIPKEITHTEKTIGKN